MESTDEVLMTTEENMQKAVDHCAAELSKVRAGKATPSMLDSVRIDYYGAMVPISNAATITSQDARNLLINPFEPKFMPVIEKAIHEANLGVNPQNDGNQIRVTLPMLTEERRKELVKMTKEIGEDSKVGIRNTRRDANDALKKLQKDGVPEDEVKGAEAQVQKLTDTHVAKVEGMLEEKEKEIMTV